MRALLSLVFWALLLFVGAYKVVEWTADYWWFVSLGAGERWRAMMGWRVGAFLGGALLSVLIFGQNVRLALSHLRTSDFALLGGPVSFHGPTFRTLEKVARALVWICAWLSGMACANRYELWAGARFYSPLGKTDAASGQDLGFFLFVLPPLDWAWSFFGVLLLVSTVVCALLYFYGELIETGPQLLRVTRAASRHLIALAAILILWSGVRQGILALEAPIRPGFSPSEIFGATQTHWEIPLRWALVFASLPLAFWVARPGALRLITRAQMALAWGILVLVFVPISVPLSRAFGIFSPAKEADSVARHLRVTRENWELESPAQPLQTRGAGWQEASRTNAVFDAWPAEPLRQAFENAEGNSERDIARAHFLPGQSPIYRAIAQLRTSSLSRSGVALEGKTSPTGALQITRRVRLTSLLLSEQPNDWPREPFWGAPNLSQNTLRQPFNAQFRFAEKPGGAVSRLGFGRRFLLSWRFRSRELLEGQAPISWQLDPMERARALYPFFDWSRSRSTPVLLRISGEDRLFWHVEGFARSRFFPDSAALNGADLWRGVNYLRPAISVVFDAQTGEIAATQTAAREPFVRMWNRAFGDVSNRNLSFFTRFRAPQNPALAKARAQIFARYRRERADAPSFADAKSEWRIWNDDPTSPDPWPSDAQGRLIFAFAPKLSGGEETQIHGLWAVAPDGKSQFFRPDAPFVLPDISKPVREETTNGRPLLPPPTRVGWEFRERENEVGLWRGVALTQNSNGRLTIESARLGRPLADGDFRASSATNATLQNLWRSFKSARQNGDWALAEKRERELDALLLPRGKSSQPEPAP